jgi:hypothetical protein
MADGSSRSRRLCTTTRTAPQPAQQAGGGAHTAHTARRAASLLADEHVSPKLDLIAGVTDPESIFAKSHTSQEGWKEGESECH